MPCRSTPNLSVVTEKSALYKMTNENFSKSLSPRRPRAPERPTPRALATPKSLSSADVDRCARFAGRKKGGGGGGARVFFSLLEERLFVFNDTAQKGPPSKCEKVSAFFVFLFFFWTKKSAFFSLFFSLVVDVLDSSRSVCRTPLLRPRVLYRSSIEQPPFLFSNTTPSSTPSRRTPARGGGSRCFGVVHESSERARGERALTSPVEGGDL